MTTTPNEPNITAAASWLACQTPHPSPVIPALQKRFGLTPKEAVEAIREANLHLARAL